MTNESTWCPTSILCCYQRFWNSGLYCIGTAALFFSISSSLVRPISKEVHVFVIVCVRSSLSMILSLIGSRSGQQNIPLFGSMNNIPLLFLRGLSGGLAMNCFYASIQRLLISEAMALLFLNPAIVAVLAFFILRESITIYGILGCISSMIGMVFVVQPPIFGDEYSWTSSRQWGVGFGVMSAFLAATAYISIRKIGKKEKPLTIAVWFHSTALLLSIIGLALPSTNKIMPSVVDWTCMILIAPCSFFAQLLISRGFQIEKAALGSAVNYLQVFFGAVLGLLLFGEPISLLALFGILLIFAGVLALATSSKRGENEHPHTGHGDSQSDKESQALLNKATEIRLSTLSGLRSQENDNS